MADIHKQVPTFGAKLESEFGAKKQAKRIRVAIIGSGIGGAATRFDVAMNHFVREHFGDGAIIDVYEKESQHIGGRLRTIQVGQQQYEAGGSIIHEENRYMAEFAKMCGLKPRSGGEDEKLYLYNGRDYVFEVAMLTVHGCRKIVKLLVLSQSTGVEFQDFVCACDTSYHLYTLPHDCEHVAKHLDSDECDEVAVANFLDKFRRVYDLQQRDRVCFRTPIELLEALDPDACVMTANATCTAFGPMVEQTIAECMREHGFGAYYIHEFAQSIMRVNYGQSVDLGAFCGAVSLAGMGARLWDVEEGNCRVPQTLLQKSKARVFLGANVTTISGSKGRYIVHARHKHKQVQNARYDAVFICCPLDSTRPIIKTKNIPGLNGGTSLESFARPYHRVVATFVRGPHSVHGLVQPGKASCGAPAMVLTTCKDADFRSFGSQQAKGHATADSGNSLPCWKIFTGEPVTPEQLERWFPEGYEHVAEKDWNAYPNYETAENRSKMAPFCLDDNHLYYVNAIEGCASAMEMSCIGAHNCVLMAVNKFTGAATLKSLQSKL